MGDRWRAVETDARGHLQAGGAGREDELNRQSTFVSFESAAQRFAQSKGELETLCGRQIFNLSAPPSRRNDMTRWRSSRTCSLGRLGALPGPRGGCDSGGSACPATRLTRGTRRDAFAHVSLDFGVIRMLPPHPSAPLSRPCCGVPGTHTTAVPTCEPVRALPPVPGQYTLSV